MTFLNLVRPSGVHALPALRTLQYLLTYTLNPDRDFFAFLPPFQSQHPDENSRTGSGTSPVGGDTGSSAGNSEPGNQTLSGPETGSGSATSFQFGKFSSALESNIAALNDSLEWAISGIGMEFPPSVEQVDFEYLVSILTEQNTSNSTIPCSRVLVIIIEEDIESDLANALLTLPESDPVLQVLFIDVSRRRSTGSESMEAWYPNVKRVYCESMAGFEESTIDVDQIARGSRSLQSYLNYLSWPGNSN